MLRYVVLGANIFILVATLAACEIRPVSVKTAKLNAMNARVEGIFSKSKTVCFGRFLIDLPEKTQVTWGPADVPLGVSVEADEGSKFEEHVTTEEDSLRSKPRFPASKKLSLYFETIERVETGVKHIVSQETFSSAGMLKISSFFKMGSSLVRLSARPLENEKEATLDELDDLVARLRPRAETEIPTESGVCIGGAFLKDAVGAAGLGANEHIRVGFRLSEFPDTHLSVYLAPATPDENARWGLEYQLRRTEEEAITAGQPSPYAMLTTLRRDKREINEWKTGFEILTRTPNDGDVKGHHDFWMKFTGEANNPLKPFADIAMKTGIKQNIAGLVEPTLTDDEAMALWNKITGSIRARPTGPMRGANGLPIKEAIGAQATTGRKCPQAGWWECMDNLPLVQTTGMFLYEGETMPHVLVWGAPTTWQRLRGERPQHRAATMWRLAALEAPKPEQDGSPAPGAPAHSDSSESGA